MKKTRVVFYARVSKDTEEQLHSFEAQKKYFEEFISRNKDMVFIRGYADEGISGVIVKKRKQFHISMLFVFFNSFTVETTTSYYQNK